jgi:hypothetical protein
MLERLKVALVESFVGAIALGWLFSQAVMHFAFIFVTPFVAWAQRKEYPGLRSTMGGPTGFSVHDALPELVRCVALLLVGYFLLRWLYFKPLKEEDGAEPHSEGSVA